MYEQDNPLKTVELSTEQNYNMIDGLPNNGLGPAAPAPGKGAGQGEGGPQQAQEPGA